MLYITYDNVSIAHNDVIQSQFANFSVQLSYHTWWSEVTRLHYLLGLIFRALFSLSNTYRHLSCIIQPYVCSVQGDPSLVLKLYLHLVNFLQTNGILSPYLDLSQTKLLIGVYKYQFNLVTKVDSFILITLSLYAESFGHALH